MKGKSQSALYKLYFVKDYENLVNELLSKAIPEVPQVSTAAMNAQIYNWAHGELFVLLLLKEENGGTEYLGQLGFIANLSCHTYNYEHNIVYSIGFLSL